MTIVPKITLLPIICIVIMMMLGDSLVTSDGNITATCIMTPLNYDGMNVSGEIRLYQHADSVHMDLSLKGFPRAGAKYGFHVHEFGNLTGNCTGAGLHYNPFNVVHGGPNDTVRHVGDLGNIQANQSYQVVQHMIDNVISLQGNYSIVNRSFVVHAGEDDLGKGGSITSNTTGNSGYRIGCCIITLDHTTLMTMMHHSSVVTTPISAAVLLGPATVAWILAALTSVFLSISTPEHMGQ